MHLALECFAPPVNSTRFEVPKPMLGEAVRLLNQWFVAKKYVFDTIDLGPPHVWSSANIVLRPPISESGIAAFSFGVLRTTCSAFGLARRSGAARPRRTTPCSGLRGELRTLKLTTRTRYEKV